MKNGDWVEAALMNHAVAAELLIQLKYADPAPIRSSSGGVAVHWSVRQRRSRQTLREKSESARDSPSTPLSWSGATSPSGATDVEDSSRADKTSDLRSKNVAVGESSNIKKQRKRKTVAELKEEENWLLKERNHLKMEIQTLAVNLEEQRAKNKHLKRVKLGTQSPPANKAVTPSLAINQMAGRPHEQIAACSPSHPAVTEATTVTGTGEDAASHPSLSNRSSEVQAEAKKEPRFVLPDLNQLPEEDSSS